MNEIIYKIERLTDLEHKIMVAGGKDGEGIVKEFGKVKYTRLYLKWITNKDLLYSTGNSIQRHAAAWMGGRLGAGGRMNTRIGKAESLCCLLETIKTLLMSYTPIQN